MKRAFPLLLLVVLVVPLAASAETTQSDFVLVREEEVVDEDLMAAGNTIQVDGTIEGDLVAAAFDRIVINGEVTGDVVAISGRVEINGTIGGSIRIISGAIAIAGDVGHDVAAAAWETELQAAGDIGRDVIVFGRNASIAGRVGRDVVGRFSNLHLDAGVGGMVEVSVGRLTIGPSTQVAGAIGYRSRSEAVIEAADPGGEVIHRIPLRPNIRVTALNFLTFSLLGLLLVAGGLTAAHYWPARLERAVLAASRPGSTWLAGIGVAFSPVLLLGLYAAFLGFAPAAAAIPLAVVFLPLAIGLFGLVLLGGLTGIVPVGGAIGRKIRDSLSLPGAVLLGLFVVAVVALVPFVRWLIPLVAVPVGLGSWLAREKRS